MKRTHIIIIAVVAVLAGVAFGLKEYTRGHEDVASMPEAHTVSAHELLAEFVADEAAATAKYVGAKEQAIKVKGVIRDLELSVGEGADNLVLDTGDDMAGIVCEFSKGTVPANWKPGDKVFVKGICQGYTGEGMMPGDVVLQRCISVEQSLPAAP